MIEVVAARPSHVGTIASRIRPIDRDECAMAGMTPKEALRHGLANSETVWTVMIDGRAEAMFGVVGVSLLEGRGRVWMLMTDVGAKQHRAIVRFGGIYTAALNRHYRILENYVSADNDRAIRWLSRLGFCIGPTDVIRGHKVRYFTRLA
ncbi:MAG TPA: hypothetical protein VF638_14335 [Sphingomonas sp.]|jgi:ribosomal protein S18 acetylase RimI-like enzyme